jgi:hypothetical protein
MLFLASKPKFFLLNALRGLSMVSLLFVFIANFVIMAQDIQAIHNESHATAAELAADEECDFIGASSVPNQAAGTFRAFLIIALNIVEIIILFLSETGFPASFFKKWIPCLDNEQSLVCLGVLQLLLAAQMMSHFLEPFPLVASFFLLIAGIFNILTMYFDRPRHFRSYEFWKGAGADNQVRSMESGRTHAYTHSHYTASAAASMFNEKQQTPASEGYGFARQDDSVLSRNPSNPSNHSSLVRASSPPTYSPPKPLARVATKGRQF